MFDIYTYLYYANIKQNWLNIMETILYIQLALFCVFIAFVSKLFINLLIDKQ